ncbi:MAG: NUDIX domain-containing protein [Armatimonadota bacterium]
MNPKRIRGVALCLFRHGDRILVDEAEDTVRRDRYCRPIGGGIEYGERSEAAIVREVREELRAEIEHLELAAVIENLFTCEGEEGHEIVFIYDAEFIDKSLYSRDILHGYEHGNDSHFPVQWRSLAEMEAAGLRLVPEQLKELLQRPILDP